MEKKLILRRRQWKLLKVVATLNDSDSIERDTIGS